MFEFTNIQEYHSQLCNNATTCIEALQYYLQQIKKNQRLNAFVEVYEEDALQTASRLDTARKAGKPMKRMHGVIIAIKDVISYRGHRLTAASAILKDFEAIYTATALQYLIDEEAIIIGNCNCDEFAMGSSNENSHYGPVLNALDESRVPGGSSGGSAVAVQAGMCMISLGSDTGGSVRQPADFCGIIGLKPGYGRISRYGLIAYASSFDQIGIFSTNLHDAALTLEVMSRPDKMDSTMNKNNAGSFSIQTGAGKKYKLCYFKETLEHPGLDPEIKNSIVKYINELQLNGHDIEALSFDLLDYIVPTYYVLTTAEASSNLGRYDGIRYGHRSKKEAQDIENFYCNNRTEGFGQEVKRRIMLGSFVLSSGYYDDYYAKAQKIRNKLVQQIEIIFSQYDGLIMPVSPGTAFELGKGKNDPIATYLADIYTVFANLTAIPAIALPLFSHSNNLPFGLQVMTKRGNELTLLQISDTLMQLKTAAFDS
ncbi:MAG: Asp-tRNA(Asn)/Glu-tRNA(Gln) amidotransferase subunit GatA [Niastella sp.]|nr:Asp-tRNA(Asn)/Glu-tRNA(Gln) amidotransferase subunit GatA [Niastella sp.]